MDKLLYTVREVAELTGLSRATLFRLMRDDRLISVKVGGSRRVPRQSLAAFVDLLERQARESAGGLR